ncbi:MAG: hypothetical protein IK079_05420 [Desulfovibrio sp.]|nr:hypothetical protein [Desulfovibrio sp.]
MKKESTLLEDVEIVSKNKTNNPPIPKISLFALCVGLLCCGFLLGMVVKTNLCQDAKLQKLLTQLATSPTSPITPETNITQNQEEILSTIENISQELQKVTQERAALETILIKTQDDLAKERLVHQTTQLPKEEGERKTSKSEQKKNQKELTDWSVVGLTSANAVINVQKKLHVVPIGGSLNGVKILGINVHTGTITTSHGQLTFAK